MDLDQHFAFSVFKNGVQRRLNSLSCAEQCSGDFRTMG